MTVRFIRQWRSHRPGSVVDVGGIATPLIRRGFAEAVEPERPAPPGDQEPARKVSTTPRNKSRTARN